MKNKDFLGVEFERTRITVNNHSLSRMRRGTVYEIQTNRNGWHSTPVRDSDQTSQIFLSTRTASAKAGRIRKQGTSICLKPIPVLFYTETKFQRILQNNQTSKAVITYKSHIFTSNHEIEEYVKNITDDIQTLNVKKNCWMYESQQETLVTPDHAFLRYDRYIGLT